MVRKDNYQIIDYFYDQIGEVKSKSDIQSRMDKIAKKTRDGGAAWELFRDNVDWFNVKSKKTGRKLSEESSSDNQTYLTNILQDIESANESTIASIGIDEAYEEDTVEVANINLENKKKEFQDLTINVDGTDFEIPLKYRRGRPINQVRVVIEALGGETIDDISSATTQEEALEVDIPSNIPNSLKSFLQSEKNNAIRSLPRTEDLYE